jgi:hypothetical protein
MLPFLAGQTIAAAAIVAVTAIAPVPSVKTHVVQRGVVSAAPAHKIYGYVVSLSGNTLVIQNRRGRMVVVDTTFAHSAVRLFRGRPVIVMGSQDASGLVHANALWRTYPDSAHWPTDR